MAGVGVAAVVGSTQSFHKQEMRTERSERMELKTPEGDLGDVEADFQTLVNEMARDGSASCSASSMKQQQSFSSTVTKQSFSSSSITSSSSNSSRMLTSSVNGTVGQTKASQIPVGPPKEAPPPPPPGTAAGDDVVAAVLAGGEGVVTAVLAQVVPEDATQRGGGESEIVVEQPMRVRDRIRRIEKQLSTEDVPAGPPEVLLPRTRSGSVKNLAEQFTHADEQAPPAPPTINAAAFKQARAASIEGEVVAVSGEFRSVKEMVSSFSQQEETSSVRRVEGEFRSVKETASMFQDPIQPMVAPIRPPAAFLTDGEAEEVSLPVAVLPPATLARPAPPAPPIPPPETVVPPPEVVPFPDPPVPTAPSYSTLLPEPTPIYDFAPMPEPAPAPTPAAPQPIIPASEPAPAVPPRDAKPGAPPPVPWRKNREDKPEPPSAPEVKPAPTKPAPAPTPAPTPAPQNPPLPPPPPQELQGSQALPLQDTPVPEARLVQPPPPPVPEQPSTSVSTSVSASTSTSASTLISTSTSTSVAAAETEKVFEEALAEINKYSETLSQTSTSRSTSAETVVHQPIQYSAQVKCEVRSRVTTPEVPEQPTPPPPQQQLQQQVSSSSSSSSNSQTSSFTKRTKTEMKTSSSSSFASSVASANSTTAAATKVSKSTAAATITAKTAAKPPKFEASSGGNEPGPPKYSLLRSASTGSMGSGEGREGRMRHAGSDKDLPKFNVKRVKDGLTSNARVWSPGKLGEDKGVGPSKIDLPDLPSFKDQPTVWSPTRAGSASPSLGRRGEYQYRKITYEGQGGLQKRPSQENINTPRAEESYAWKDICVDKVSARSPTSGLPKVQNPTVTLLQKKREGQILGKRPEYLKPDDLGPKYKPDDKLYVIKREYESEDESGGRKFAVLGPKKVAGVGPTTTDGIPVTLKSGIKSEHQGEWYRRMFDSLHKIKDARYGGYMSEPEGYDSDVGSSRYATLDHRRPLHHFQIDPMTSSLPRNASRYVHQPGRIEDYVPGYSSLSDKEHKRNPELESKSQEPPAGSANHRIGSQMSMTHALKESGYESDSTLVFKKREDARRQAPDPRKTSQQYRQVQRGGDIPFTGLQKPNTLRPRESPYKYEAGEVNIHYRTPVRIEQKEAIPEEELARRQEEHMKKVYENERRKKYLAELEDIERRRHTDNFTPLQKSPIPLNRYDDESSLGTLRGGARTPDVKQVARALYNFTAQNKRELTFNKGDGVYIRRQIDKNWYEGELRGSVGIFPCNYVEIVPYENVKTMTRRPTEGQARARFNFQAQTSMEMSLSKGELVVLSRRVDENWYEGRIGNRKGIFPVSYVDTLVEPGCNDRPMSPSSSPLPRPALPAATLLYNGASSYSSPYSTLGRPGSQNDNRPYHQSLTVNTQQEPIPYRALYNYKPQNDDELELVEGDLVMVMEKCDDGWFVGTSRRTGLFGTFPGNYVEKV